MTKAEWGCFFGFHDWESTTGKKSGIKRTCVKCNKEQEMYKCGASDTWRWRTIRDNHGNQ